MLGDDLYFFILEIFRIRLIISLKEFGAGMGTVNCSFGSFGSCVLVEGLLLRSCNVVLTVCGK